MSQAGAYLYGFTDRGFQPPPDLRGLRGAPVEVIGFADLAAVVSDPPVQRLMPARSWRRRSTPRGSGSRR